MDRVDGVDEVEPFRGLGSPFSALWWFTLSVGFSRDIRFYQGSWFMLMDAYEEGG